MIYEREYGVAATVSFPIIAFSLTSYHSSVTSTVFAAGDVKISKNYGAASATATLPSGVMSNGSVLLSLTASELQGAHIVISIIDATATKVFEDQTVIIETFGATTAAQFQFNRNQSTVQASLTADQSAVTFGTVNNFGASAAAQGILASLTANNVVVVGTITTTAIISNLGASATAQINAQVDTALVDIGLDHLLSVAVVGADVTDNSIFAKLVSASTTADWDHFTNPSHSLQAIRERGDAAWVTGGGGSATTTAQLVWDLTASAHATADTFGGRLQNSVPSLPIQASLTAAQTGVTVANVTTVATTNNLGASAVAQVLTTTINQVNNFGASAVAQVLTNTVHNLAASATAQINAEVDTSLADASVTANVMNTIITNLDRANSSVIVASMTSTVVLNNLGSSATTQINSQVSSALNTFHNTSLPGLGSISALTPYLGLYALAERLTVVTASNNTQSTSEMKIDGGFPLGTTNDTAKGGSIYFGGSAQAVRRISSYTGAATGSSITFETNQLSAAATGASYIVRFDDPTGNLTSSATADVVDKVWDETATDHNTSTAFGSRLQNTVPSLPIQASLTADQSGITIGQVNNLGASATAQINSEVDTALSDISATANVMNTIITNLDRAVSSAIVASMTSTVILNNLGASATTQINDEVVDVLKTDTITEQSAGVPPAAPTFEQAIDYIYMAWRNKVDTTASVTSITNDAGTTIASAVISDDGTTFTKQEFS